MCVRGGADRGESGLREECFNKCIPAMNERNSPLPGLSDSFSSLIKIFRTTRRLIDTRDARVFFDIFKRKRSLHYYAVVNLAFFHNDKLELETDLACNAICPRLSFERRSQSHYKIPI